MKYINFELKKNNKIQIKENNIKCIENDRLIFYINKNKYIFIDDILEIKKEEETIIFNFKKEECKISIKGYKDYLILKINVINIKKTENIILIKYNIETEENIINTIKIEYK